MKNTTKDMAQDTGEMRKSMGVTTDKLESTHQGIVNTYADLRQDEALKIRNDMLITLEGTSTLEAKVVTAGKYCMAFEFQLWKDNLNDTPEYREQLFRDAMEEFFLDLRRYMPDPGATPDPTSSNSRMQNLMAIAGTIDRVNPNAQVLARKSKSEPVSILSLIHDALKKADQVERGEIRHDELLPHEQQVLVYQSEAKALLQARANFLPVMLLSRISDIQSRNLAVQAWMAYWGSDAKFDNIEALQQGLEFISSANEEIRFLRQLGEPVKFNMTLRQMYKNMELPKAGKSARSLKLDGDQRAARTVVETALLKEIEQFKAYLNGTAQ